MTQRTSSTAQKPTLFLINSNGGCTKVAVEKWSIGNGIAPSEEVASLKKFFKPITLCRKDRVLLLGIIGF